MAQHIGIQKIDENGLIRESCKLNFAVVINFLKKINGSNEQYPLLASIDPYGDTILNKNQLSLLMTELVRLQAESKEEIKKHNVDAMMHFFNQLDTNQYIKFIGD